MTRTEVQSILQRHSPFPLYDPAEPAVYKDWVVDAVLDAVAKERERCAEVCEDVGPKDGALALVTAGFAAAIRARS